MKQQLAKLFLGLSLCQAAWGGPSPIYQNLNPVTIDTPTPVVDALTFYNANEFEVVTFTTISPTNLSSGFYENGFSPLPFTTKDTLVWTNAVNGFMQGTPGFRFDTATSTSRHSSSYFINQGTIEALDEPAFPYLFGVIGSTTLEPSAAASQPIASQVQVLCTNIVNTGTLEVGSYGLLKLAGKNVTNANAALIAGAVDTAGLIPDPLDTIGLSGEEQEFAGDLASQSFFVPSPGVYDVFWGVSNAVKEDLTAFFPPDSVPTIPVNSRGLFGFGFPFIFDTTQYSFTAQVYTNGTNAYYNMVFVNTNFSSSNLTADVAFSFGSFVFATNPVANAYEDIVRIAEPVYDIITGQVVTNGIYLIDDGAILSVLSLSDNASLPDGFSRPNAFAVTTETPIDWIDSFPGNSSTYDPDLVYTPNQFLNQTVPFNIAEYGAQIGRNPASLTGSFTSLLETNTFAFEDLQFSPVNLPDPTNEPGRIEISAQNLDLTQARLRAEGMVVLNVTNLIGGGTQAVDWGEANANIGVTNGSLVLSNIFPTTFQRVRGDISAYSASWQNVQTNAGEFIPGGPTNTVTNLFFYHILIVDQTMFGSFPSTLRNLNLTGKKSIVLQDNLNVINQAVINTTNLTINSSNFFSQNAANFTPANVPLLQNLLINSNGLLGASQGLDIGFNINQAQTTPVKRKYTVNTITNFGQMVANSPVFQSATFENDGEITANNVGSIVIEANTLGLGLAVTNTTNSLLAGGSVTLSANTIAMSNSLILAGLSGEGALTLYATKELTDFVPGVATTNTNSVIINHLKVTGGFSLPVKPVSGDLFGTEIHTVATGFEQAFHVWAGKDMGATPAGFVNNEVIGRLVMDRQSSNSILRFSAAGAVNAMYVDFLELTNSSYSDYRRGLVIDPNFTIYFADCNADPEKLMEVYPRLIWVQNFAGPNSTQIVPYLNSSNVCLMNAALANSQDISFFNGLANYYNQPYLLNDPNNPAITYPCPGDESTLRSLLVATPISGSVGSRTLNLLNITVKGDGSVTPNLVTSQIALGKNYALTAKPAKGWVFQNWSTIGLAGAVNANASTLSFNFVTNTVITANFIPNPFGAVQRVYNGLFFQPGAVDPGSSGSFTLTLSPSGSFSGHLVMGPSTYSFSSQFSGAGGAQVPAKSGAQSVTLNLQLDMTGQSGQIVGDINGGGWDAPLVANVAPSWTAQNPSPLAGKYTMVLPWPSGGDSYGAGTLNSQGVLTLAGALADGVPFSESAPVSQWGQWPFYVYAAAGKDSVLGWVTVSNGLASTNVTWSKVASKGLLYPAGFTNILQLTGSFWQAPAKKTSALTLTNPVVTLSYSGWPAPLTTDVTLQNYLTYTATNLTLSINGLSGSFSGWFDDRTGRKQTISGVVLQNAGSARGFFKGANESGAVLLQDNTPTQ